MIELFSYRVGYFDLRAMVDYLRIILLRALSCCFCFCAVGCGGYQPLSSIEPIPPGLWSELQGEDDDRALITLPSGSPATEP